MLERVDSELIKQIALIVSRMKDPRVAGNVTVTAVKTTADLKFAKVYTAISSGAVKSEVLGALNSAAGFIMKELNSAVTLRRIPKLSFISDESMEYGAKIDKIIKSLKDGENKN
ncbi:MAG TPA: 30S ribosome-binding factor RbfA [Eubacteriales bacterium]|jgi:ribosome-binding factor A|nr:30S ribosome-binding factor RbfA [Eubacteriales bacterium]HRU84095.1 30S ribosome-binding factor RbfA [Eubacteriales bacterium]